MSLTTLIVVIVFLALLAGAFKDPLYGVQAYIFVYLLVSPYRWYCQAIFQVISRPSLFAMIVLSLSCMIHFDKLNWRITKKEMAFYLFGATAWIVTQYFGVLIDAGTTKYLTKLLKTLVFLFLFFRVVHSYKSIDVVVWTIILCGIFLAYQGHVSGNMSSGRLESIGGSDFSESNSLGGFLMSCIILIGFKLFKAPIWRKGGYALSIALMFNAFILTQSRAVFLGLIFAAPLPVLKIQKQFQKQLWLYIVLALVMLLILTNETFFNRMGTVAGKISEISKTDYLFNQESISRIDFWTASIKIFKDHPMGIGVNNFANIVPNYDSRNPGMDPHNTFVLCYTEIGIIGILIFLFIIMESFLELLRIHKIAYERPEFADFHLLALSIGCIFMLFFFGSMMTHSMLYVEMVWIYMALSTCLQPAFRNILAEFE